MSETRKIKLTLQSWKNIINLPVPILKVKALKVKYLFYTTASTGGRDLTISCSDWTQNGMQINNDGSNSLYFFSFPIDSQSDVSNVFTNYLEEKDVIFPYPIQSIDRFTLEIKINGIPTNDISPSNPLIMELQFYVN